MILTDREIQLAIESGQIVISPRPDPTVYSSTSVDLTLAADGLRWKNTPGMPIQPGAPGFKYTSISHLQEKVTIRQYHLKPKSFLLAWTRETVELPIRSRIAARVEGKSSIARLGVGIHITAPTIPPGFAARSSSRCPTSPSTRSSSTRG